MQLKSACKSALWILPAFALDRMTKVWAQRALMENDVFPVFPGVLSWRLTYNTGMAFSLLSGNTPILAAATVLVLAVLLFVLLRNPDMHALPRAGIGLIVAGGLGNLFDRVFLGRVVDFIEPVFMRFAVFNVADICVCVGAALIALSLFLPEKRTET